MHRLPATGVRAVPFLDLAPIHEPLREQLLDELSSLIESGEFTNGPQVAAFERRFADFCGTVECVGLASGLDALRLALLALGIEAGDEVIVPAQTFVATLEAVTQAGAKPVPVEISEDDYGLDAAAAEAAVTPRTRFLMPVHLYGQMADMRRLNELARRHDLSVVEDACQAHGATRDGVRSGAAGTAAAFSFYPAKNLGAMGDAGALVMDDQSLAHRVRALREHGQTAKYRHELEGFTSRLDTIQALVLLHKLPHLDSWNDERRRAAAFYSERLGGIGDLVLPPQPAGSSPVWHLYVIRTQDPVRLAQFLGQRGVRTARHYPQPPHLAPAYAQLGYVQGAFPVAEALAREGLSLPIFPGITEEQLETVADAVEEYFAHG